MVEFGSAEGPHDVGPLEFVDWLAEDQLSQGLMGLGAGGQRLACSLCLLEVLFPAGEEGAGLAAEGGAAGLPPSSAPQSSFCGADAVGFPGLVVLKWEVGIESWGLLSRW